MQEPGTPSAERASPRAPRGSMRPLAGVDGCRGGWVVATRDGVARVDAFRGALKAAGRGALVLVDMPIGLLDAPTPGGRACDRDARRRLAPFGHRVFSPPARCHLAAGDFAACRGLTLQAWNILPKVREVDEAVTRRLQRRVREAHPELAFAAMNGGAPLPSKHTPAGLRARQRLVGRVDPPRGARLDDALDAMALRWSAARLAAGAGEALGDGSRDARGLRMEIAF